MNDNLIIKIKDTTKGRLSKLGYSYYLKKDNVDSVIGHKKPDFFTRSHG